ncbi:hypothetical protein IWX64_000344 [Arthrobacter sp. CAN_A212]|uniref:hypothetical protein n=1 Tax=Arthrobacter sp. CAN_A212 TaxID=2787719 RepID=UPI0018CA1667
MARLVREENAGDCGLPGRRDEWNFDMTDPQTGRSSGTSGSTRVETGRTGGEAVAGPFTLRETVIGGSVLVIFIGSVLPFFEAMGRFGNLWNSSSLFFLAIGIVLPIATTGLLTARRLGTDTRVGSLSVDQFASVVAVLATAFFFLQTVTSFHYGPLICLIGSLGMLAATVGGPHLPGFAVDFAGRPSAEAHVVARKVLPAKPKAPKAPKAPMATATQSESAEEVTQWSDGAGRTGAAAAAAGTTAGTTAGSPAGSPAEGRQPGTPKKPGSALRNKLGFGAAAKASATDPSRSTPDAHLDSSVAAVPGVQDKEISDADSSGYPRFADEDFAPYATSADSAKSPDSAKPAGATSSSDKEEPARSAAPAGTATPAGATTPTGPTNAGNGDAATAQRESTEQRESTGDQRAERDADRGTGTNAGSRPAEQASADTGRQDAVSGGTAASTGASAGAAAAAGTAAGTAAAAAATTAQPVVEHRGSGNHESISATKSEDEGPVVEAFWFAVGTPRPVVDEASGVELFVLRPGDWEVGIEDRGEEFLVQDKRTGRVGVMRDLSNIERAPSDG